MRQSISDLLCRIAKNAAHLVVYPVVVATTHADQRSRTLFRNSLQDDKVRVTPLFKCTNSIVASMQMFQAQLIAYPILEIHSPYSDNARIVQFVPHVQSQQCERD